MTSRRFFVPAADIRDGIARLPADELHHLRHVLRLAAGARVEIFDGEGNCYSGTVGGLEPELYVEELERIELHAEPPIDCTLALALVKAERFEWALEKATELGVRAIIPLDAARSQARVPPNRLEARLERWRRIVRSAAKQSRRSAVPEISAPRTLAELVEGHGADYERLLLVERAGQAWPSPASRRVVMAVGPEGGWESAEVGAAEGAGWRGVALGPRILRAETAAIAALVIVQFVAGDLGPAPGADRP